MTIIPKMHYMLHYPSQIRKYGPLVHSWTMRYESKLRILKRASRHENICKTVAKKHQHLLCYYLNNGRPFFQRNIEVGPTESTSTLSSYTDFHQFISDKVLASVQDEIEHPKFIKFITPKWCLCVQGS